MSKLCQLLNRIAIDHNHPEAIETYIHDFVPNILLKHETVQASFGITKYEMEEIYHEGYTQYQDDNCIASSTTFRWLTLFNPYEARYWMGWAASLQMLEKYEQALHAYSVLALLDSSNPYPHFHAYECCSELGNQEDADKALKLAYKRTLGKFAYRDLQQRIMNLRVK